MPVKLYQLLIFIARLLPTAVPTTSQLLLQSRSTSLSYVTPSPLHTQTTGGLTEMGLASVWGPEMHYTRGTSSVATYMQCIIESVDSICRDSTDIKYKLIQKKSLKISKTAIL